MFSKEALFTRMYSRLIVQTSKPEDPVIMSEYTLEGSDPFQSILSGNVASTLTSNSNRTPIIEVFR